MMFAPAQKIRSFRLVDDDGVDLGVLEPDALDGVGELDVDAEVVGVELQPVVRRQPGVLLDVHRQRRDGTVEGELPVLVAIGAGVERDGRRGGLGHKGWLKLNECSNTLDAWQRASQPRRAPAGPAGAAPRGGAESRRTRRGHPRPDPQERGRGVPPPRLPRRDRRADRRRAPHEEGEPLLLLQEQGRDPLRLPPVLARPAAGAARRGRTERRSPPTRSCAGSSSPSSTRSSTSCTARRSSSTSRRCRRRTSRP